MKINVNKGRTYFDKLNKERKIDFPYDMMLEEKRSLSNPGGKDCAYFDGGIYHFQKFFNFDVSAYKYFAFHFNQIYKKAIIKLNGEVIKENLNGFNDFYVEFKPKNGENLVEIIAYNNLLPNCRWYTGSGVLRDIELIYKKENEIKNVRVYTKNYLNREILIDADIKESVSYTFEIFDDKNNLVYKGEEKEITLKDAKLWSIDEPNLYKLVVKTPNDEETIRFGIRNVSLDVNKGLLLNGERVILKGCCVHGDNGILGAVSYKDYEYLKVFRLKKEGFNAIRCAHNPCSTHFLEVCDELGMLVMDEAFDGWYIPKNYHDISRIFIKVYEETLKNMVKKDFNHPSVIMYSLGNEISEIVSQKGLNLLKEMNDILKKEDPTRFTTIGVNLLIAVYAKMGINVYKDDEKYVEEPLKQSKKIKQKKSGSATFNALMDKLGWLMFKMSKSKKASNIAEKVSKYIDILGLNYGTPRYELDSKTYPNRFMLGSETLIKHVGVNYYSSVNIKTVIGDFLWAGIDYLGEALSNAYFYYSNKGLPILAGGSTLDFTLKGNSQLDYVKTVWENSKKPRINVSPLNHYNETPYKSAWRFTNTISTYNFKGFDGKKCLVEVFSSASKIKLLLNGVCVGTKKVKNYTARFKTKYYSGEIEAIALDENDKIIDSSKLTSGNEINLNVTLSKCKIRNNGEDLSFIEIEFVDENKQIYSTIEEEISIEISENLTLAGIGSAIAATNESYLSNKFKSYQGRAVAIVKSNSDLVGKAWIKIKNNLTKERIIEMEVINDGEI